MLNGGQTFSMGWRPETGFISTRWDHYSELMMLYLLAIGSPTHPVPPESWSAFTRPPMTFGPYTYISGKDPLFVHQFSHAWFDFARQRDAYANYFANSITATRAHKAFCLSLNRGYNDDYWGVSASDWQHGYTAWGGPPLMGPVDGSVVPSTAAGSLPFLPRECCPRPPRPPRHTSARTPGAATDSVTPSTPSCTGTTPTSSASISALVSSWPKISAPPSSGTPSCRTLSPSPP